MPANALSSIKSKTPSSIAEPLTAFRFTLRVEAVYVLPCRAVKGLQRENEFDYIQEGGLNDYVHLKRKPISKPYSFQVERYVGTDSGFAFLGGVADPIALGTELVLPVILSVDTAEGKQVRTYVFTGCTVIGKNYGELNAENSTLLVETTTITYREMICVDIAHTFEPTMLKGDTVYKKKKDHSKENSEKRWTIKEPGKNRHMAEGKKQMDKKNMEEIAEKERWDIKNPEKNRHMKEAGQQTDKDSMRKAADKHLWNIHTPSVTCSARVNQEESEKVWKERAEKKRWNPSDPASRHMTEVNTGAANVRSWDIHSEEEERSAAYNADEVKKSQMEETAKGHLWKIQEPLSGRAATVNEEESLQEWEGKAAKEKWNPSDLSGGHMATVDTGDAEIRSWDIHSRETGGSALHSSDETKKSQMEETAKGHLWNIHAPSSQRAANVNEEETAEIWEGKAAKEKWNPADPSGGHMATVDTGKAQVRVWPSQSSAATWEGTGKEQAAVRKWPPQKSAKTLSSKKAESRLWPKKRSAQDINAFLKNSSKKKK